MSNPVATYELIHFYPSDDNDGITRYSFVPPEGFDVPYGVFTGEPDDIPEFQALVRYFEIDFEPEKDDIIEVKAVDETVYSPTFEELKAS